MQTVIDNILVNYEVQGKENISAILILHGWRQNLSHWQQVAKALSQKNKVISLDLPGFGSSSIPPTVFSTNDYATFVKKFIEKLDLSKIVLLGHSFGGKIAIKMASRSQDISKLIIISPSGIDSKPILIKLKIIIFKPIKPLLSWLPKNLRTNLSRIFSSADYYHASALRETFKKIVDERVENDAIKINIPTLIIWGENDKEINIRNSKVLKDLISNSVLRIIWKVGHSPNIETPEKLSDLLLEYI